MNLGNCVVGDRKSTVRAAGSRWWLETGLSARPTGEKGTEVLWAEWEVPPWPET